MTTTEIVPADNMAALEALDPQQRAMAITSMLAEARSWLAHAKEATEPRTIVNFKAQMATVAEASKQLGLSKDIQLDAVEMVRRAERGVDLAIREGQARGDVSKVGDFARRSSHTRLKNGREEHVNGVDPDETYSKARPSDFLPNANERSHAYALGGVSEEQFEDAIAEAKDEGNLSRANVVRKAKKKSSPESKRHDLLRNTHHHNPARIVEQTAIALDGLAMGLALVTPGSVPEDSKAEHTQVMKDAISKIRTFIRTEMSQS